jgi:chaperone modulatory protein CbpM
MSTETEVLWLDEHRVVSLGELVDLSGLTEGELVELVRLELIELRSDPGQEWLFSARVVTIARQACRLRDQLELDMPGLAVALRLLERVRELEDEIARLRALLPRV